MYHKEDTSNLYTFLYLKNMFGGISCVRHCARHGGYNIIMNKWHREPSLALCDDLGGWDGEMGRRRPKSEDV